MNNDIFLATCLSKKSQHLTFSGWYIFSHKTFHQVQFIFTLWTSGKWCSVVWSSQIPMILKNLLKIKSQDSSATTVLTCQMKRCHMTCNLTINFNFKTVILNPNLEWNAVGQFIWTHQYQQDQQLSYPRYTIFYTKTTKFSNGCECSFTRGSNKVRISLLHLMMETGSFLECYGSYIKNYTQWVRQ